MLLRHQLAGEAAGIPDNDDANAVALDAVKAAQGRVSIGSAPDTAASLYSATKVKPARLAKPSMAACWRLSLSLSPPSFAADEVRM
jgi:hypothetical protein